MGTLMPVLCSTKCTMADSLRNTLSTSKTRISRSSSENYVSPTEQRETASTERLSGRYTRAGMDSIPNTSASWDSSSTVMTEKMSLGESTRNSFHRWEVFTKASFVFLAFTHTVQSIHARGTDRSVLGVGKQQYHVVISRPIDDIGFKLRVGENANTVACNGSHLHIVPLRA